MGLALGGGDVSNAATGTIISTNTQAGGGVSIAGGAGIVRNSGLISTAGASFGRGVALRAGGYVSNSAGGRIIVAGDVSVYADGGVGTVMNQGIISGGRGMPSTCRTGAV